MTSPATLNVTLDPTGAAAVTGLRIRTYKAPHTPSATPDVTELVSAPVGGFQTSNLVPISGLEGLVGFHVDISVAAVGAGGGESSEVFADNLSIVVGTVAPVEAPTSVHVNA